MKFVFAGAFLFLVLCSGIASWWQTGTGDDRIQVVWMTGDNPVCRKQIALFNDSQETYRVVLDPQPSNMAKTVVQCLGGVGPDLFDCWFPFQLTAFVRAGIPMDLTEILPARGITPDSLWPCTVPLVQLDDRLYGHPANASANALWFNKRLFREAGLPVPTNDWTWDDCVATAARLTRFDPTGRPLQFGLLMDEMDWRLTFLPQFGGRLYSPEGTRSALDSPEAAAAMQFNIDLMHKHRVSPTEAAQTAMAASGGYGTNAIALFGAGKGAMAIGGRWWLCILRGLDYKDLELGCVVMPAGPSGRAVFGGGRSTLINERTERLDGALAFLEFMHGQPFNQLVNREADALAPVREYHYGEHEAVFLHDPNHPGEDFNVVWRNAMETAIPDFPTPFISGETETRILKIQNDLARANAKTGAEAMRDAAREINAAITRNLRRDPALRERYLALVAAGAPPAWDRPEDAP